VEHSRIVHCNIRQRGCRGQALRRWSLFGKANIL
jgi:hypothetical protein